jgi:glycosyltransferase involved in cell wall biosynthesis
MSAKHILFISSWYPNRSNPAHGIFNRHFAGAAAINNKVSVLHVSSDESVKNSFEFVKSNDRDIWTLHVYYKKASTRIPLLSSLLKLCRLLKAYKLGYRKIVSERGSPDLIHLNIFLPAGIGVWYLHKKFRLPYVVNEGWTGYAPEDGRYRGAVMKTATKMIAGRSSVILPVTGYLKDLMIAHGIKGNYRVLPNVVNTALFAPGAINTGHTRFIHVSTLDDEQKNVSGIFNAFAEMLKHEAAADLVIVGDGAGKLKLKLLAQHLNIAGHVIFTGQLSQEELVREINLSHAMVLFSNYETFCLAAAEALACGRPVITSNVGGILSYMKAGFGMVVPAGDEQALASAMIEFGRNRTRFDAVAMRDHAVKNFNVDVIAGKLDEVYAAALKNGAT